MVFRASLKAWIVMTVMFGGFFAFSVHAFVVVHESFEPLIYITGVLWAWVVLWLLRFRIVVRESSILFQSLYRSGELQSSDVRKVALAWDTGSGLQGPMRLKVLSNRENSRDLDINAQVFSQKAVSAVLAFGRRTGGVEGDELENGLVQRALRSRARGKKNEASP